VLLGIIGSAKFYLVVAGNPNPKVFNTARTGDALDGCGYTGEDFAKRIKDILGGRSCDGEKKRAAYLCGYPETMAGANARLAREGVGGCEGNLPPVFP